MRLFKFAFLAMGFTMASAWSQPPVIINDTGDWKGTIKAIPRGFSPYATVEWVQTGANEKSGGSVSPMDVLEIENILAASVEAVNVPGYVSSSPAGNFSLEYATANFYFEPQTRTRVRIINAATVEE